MAANSEKKPKLDEVMGRVALVTQSLLEDGAQPSQVVFALTSVAADTPEDAWAVLHVARGDQASAGSC